VVLRIEEHPDRARTTLVLSGRIESSDVQALKLQIDGGETDVARAAVLTVSGRISNELE
jgi:hypothetical protein